MTHSNAVVDGNGVELGSIAAHLLDLFADNLTNLMQMGMPRDKLCERIDDGYNGLSKLLLLHARCHPEGAGAGHTATFSANGTA